LYTQLYRKPNKLNIVTSGGDFIHPPCRVKVSVN
jgi:hypothetical protein